MITAQDIRDRLTTAPFVPFRIVMSSGSTYDVYHPDMVLVTRRTLSVGIYELGRPELPERSATVSVLHIAELQNLSISTPS